MRKTHMMSLIYIYIYIYISMRRKFLFIFLMKEKENLNMIILMKKVDYTNKLFKYIYIKALAGKIK